MQVSLVICTRNRAVGLKRCLQYVARQRPSCTWELVVVDNGSRDETSAVVTEYASGVPFPVQLVAEPVAGLGRARNAGWTASCGEVVAFTDDDCYIAADYIDRVHGVFSDPRVGFAGGRVELFDPTDFPLTINTATEPEFLKPRSNFTIGPIIGANMMFRREVLEAIGGFDPDFGAGTVFACEDIDALARASFAGWWGLYTPDVAVIHHHGRKAKDAQALRRTYAKGIGAYRMKLLLASDTRPAFWRAAYRTAVRALEGKVGPRLLALQVEGAAEYAALRLRRRINRFGSAASRPLRRELLRDLPHELRR